MREQDKQANIERQRKTERLVQETIGGRQRREREERKCNREGETE